MAQLGDAVRHVGLKSGSPLAGLDLSITAARISEALSEPFAVYIDLAGSKAPTEIIGNSLVGSDAALEIKVTDDKTEYWHGIVRSFGYVSSAPSGASNIHEYRAVIVPKVWRLSLNARYRVFSDMKTADIVQQVMSESGLPAPKNSSVLNSGKREYCTQFGETDLAFISRLLAEEGISYRFDSDSSQSQVALLKAPDSQKVEIDERLVQNLLFDACLHAGAAEVLDYDDNKAAGTQNNAKSKSDFADKSGTVRTFGRSRFTGGEEGEHTIDSAFGKAAADVSIQHLESSANGTICAFDYEADTDTSWSTGPGAHLSGISAADELSGGKKLVVTGRQITLTESYEGGSGFGMHIECAQAIDYFVPAPLPKPLPPGPFSATVTAVKASESDTGADPCRLVKVSLPWADDPLQTCWMRVAQGYAGKGWGASFVPRVSQEVLVEFINGDIDRPVVICALYNGKNAGPAYTSTQSGFKTESGNFNELRFDDKNGSEEVYLEAGKDLNFLVHDSRTGTIDQNDTLTVKGQQSVTVDKTRTDTTTQAHVIESKDSIELKVSGCSIKISPQGIVISALGNEIKLEAAGVSVKGSTLKMNSESTAELKANASVSVEGSAMAEVKSSGMTTVKGSVTMVN